MNVVQYDQYIYDQFFSDKNLDCVQIHGDEDPKNLFKSVGYDYSRMWNDDFEELKMDGWGWANKYFQKESEIVDYYDTSIFEEIRNDNCIDKVGFYKLAY